MIRWENFRTLKLPHFKAFLFIWLTPTNGYHACTSGVNTENPMQLVPLSLLLSLKTQLESFPTRTLTHVSRDKEISDASILHELNGVRNDPNNGHISVKSLHSLMSDSETRRTKILY